MTAPKEKPELVRTIKPDEANANPTKAFFISLITRDVNITDCIKDLIDNSIDGAIRNGHRQPLSKFRIEITAKPEKFEILDNCGGIELQVARDYAFRFGRPEDKVERDKAIAGRYGIGMKRAIFKLGNTIDLETSALHSSFALHLDVKEWQKDDSFPWVFKLSSITDKKSCLEDTLTMITIEDLRDEVEEEFDDAVNLKHLALDLEFAYSDRIQNGLQLYLNGTRIKRRKMELLVSSKVKPLRATDKFRDVQIELFAGLAPEEESEELTSMDCGWYVFCNKRLLLAADKTGVTGWGKENDNPAFHPQYNQFRGYVFFECKDVDQLPWNTAKNHINTESPVYRYALPKLGNALRDVKDYLNARKEARSQGDRRYDTPLGSAKPRPLSTVPHSGRFKVVVTKKQRQSTDQRISYQRPVWMVERIIEVSGADSPKAAGEFTFDDYFKKNCK